MQIQVCLSFFRQRSGAGPGAPPGFCGDANEPGRGTPLVFCSHVECVAGGMPTYMVTVGGRVQSGLSPESKQIPAL